MEGDEKLIRYNELYPPEKTSSNRFFKNQMVEWNITPNMNSI